MSPKRASLLLTLAFIFGGVQAVTACTPIPYLFELFAVNSPVMGAVSLLGTFFGKGIAWDWEIPVPSAGAGSPWLALGPLFFTLALLTLIKSLFIRPRLAGANVSFPRILGAVIWANVLSTLASFVFIIGFLAPMLFLGVLFIAFFLMNAPARLLGDIYFPGRPGARILLLLGLATSGLVATIWLMHAKAILLSADPDLAWYWFHKIGFCTYTIFSGLMVTTAIEARAILAFFPAGEEDLKTFFQQMLRYNSYALLVLFAIGALLAIPLRLQDPNFLL